MRLRQWLASVFAPFRRASEAPRADSVDPLSAGTERPALPELDVAEEFQKLHRGLRRLSLASDRSGEILQAVSARLDETQQRLLQIGRPQRVAVTLEEADLLSVLDQLDRAANLAELPAPAGEWVAGAKDALLRAAGWQSIAVMGAKPEGVGIRIAEFIGEFATNGTHEALIHRILQQGYRRADGSLLRPGVVIAAAGSTQTHDTLSRGVL
jgi:molecular chaperone GrpE (heat shock protein)